ncbi:MAG: 5-(carboxyamino)imidazole ribonucleotide mutase [Deltaproteobacteria bacterium]|nr:5-(carboxyamino)imidazole ribonucleotide mutase [Deltaproteobacteria bacterium]MBI4373964.1 5-(carboxyamino)imidazole ribonucleotide mutase [Deltaproteobacteria bacterium]
MTKNKRPVVGILMGSDSDAEIMQEASTLLGEFGIASEMVIASAHRSPRRTAVYAGSADRRGLRVLIAGAGHAAHLAGVVASMTTLPVIGVPIDSSALKGLDSILSTVQMPAGVPVATMAIGKSGAKNAGLLAIEILALSDLSLKRKLAQYRKKMEKRLKEKDRQLRKGAR